MCKYMSLYAIAALLLIVTCETGASIGCFKCISTNNDFRACDDEFHNNVTTKIYESPCMGGRKGRDGTYPATFCIKMAGEFTHNGTHLTVRGCALDSGTVTTDTELVRLSHCGYFTYQGWDVRGCVQSCSDADGCNAAKSVVNPSLFLTSLFVFKCVFDVRL